MQVTIVPTTQRLIEIVKQHGADGWVVLRNDPNCCQRAGKKASLVVKNNLMVWLIDEEIKC